MSLYFPKCFLNLPQEYLKKESVALAISLLCHLCLNMNGMKKEKGTSDSYERYVESEVWTKGEYIQSAYYRRKGPACSRLGIRSQDICRFS